MRTPCASVVIGSGHGGRHRSDKLLARQGANVVLLWRQRNFREIKLAGMVCRPERYFTYQSSGSAFQSKAAKR